MKKVLLVLAMVMLLLSGCVDQTQSPSTTVPATQPTEPSGTYVANSFVEQQAQGAIRMYDLGNEAYDLLFLMGEKLLVGSADKQAKLCVLEGERGVVASEVVLNASIADSAFQAIPTGVVYYDGAAQAAVFLDVQL